jgi:hypothetical protein
VRGGGELGSAWHLSGKLNKKKNSISDFLDVANLLCSPMAVSDHFMVGSAVINSSDSRENSREPASSIPERKQQQGNQGRSMTTRQVTSHQKLAAWGRSAGDELPKEFSQGLSCQSPYEIGAGYRSCLPSAFE